MYNLLCISLKLFQISLLPKHIDDLDAEIPELTLAVNIRAHAGPIQLLSTARQSRLGPAAYTKPYTPRMVSVSDCHVGVWTVDVNSEGEIYFTPENSIVRPVILHIFSLITINNLLHIYPNFTGVDLFLS